MGRGALEPNTRRQDSQLSSGVLDYYHTGRQHHFGCVRARTDYDGSSGNRAPELSHDEVVELSSLPLGMIRALEPCQPPLHYLFETSRPSTEWADARNGTSALQQWFMGELSSLPPTLHGDAHHTAHAHRGSGLTFRPTSSSATATVLDATGPWGSRADSTNGSSSSSGALVVSLK